MIIWMYQFCSYRVGVGLGAGSRRTADCVLFTRKVSRRCLEAGAHLMIPSSRLSFTCALS